MITLIKGNFNTIIDLCLDIDKYYDDMNNLVSYKIECGCRKKGCCIKYGRYKRILINNDKKMDIFIQRVYCKHCKKTHSILPRFIIPYEREPFDYVLDLVLEFKDKEISKEFGINPTYDVSAEIPHRLIFAIKDLRNSIAHNNVVFDTRFKTAKIANSVLNLLYNELNISVNFEEIFDYLCLIVFMLKKLGLSKTSMRKFVSEFQSIVTIAKNNLPFNIFSKFISTNIRHKINLLNSYISKK